MSEIRYKANLLITIAFSSRRQITHHHVPHCFFLSPLGLTNCWQPLTNFGTLSISDFGPTPLVHSQKGSLLLGRCDSLPRRRCHAKYSTWVMMIPGENWELTSLQNANFFFFFDALLHLYKSPWDPEWVSGRANERMSAAERASEAISAEQANEWAVRANEWTKERMT